MSNEHLFRCMLRVIHREQLVKAYHLLNEPSKHHLRRMAQSWGVRLQLRVYVEMSGDTFVTTWAEESGGLTMLLASGE